MVAQCVREHDTRAMLDGQIHDIQKVGSSIVEVKETREKQTGRRLQDVCIAAAGRVLRTISTEVLMEFDEDTVVTAALLKEKGVISKIVKDGVKVLGNGELTKRLTVQVAAFTRTAQQKIEALGGKAEVV